MLPLLCPPTFSKTVFKTQKYPNKIPNKNPIRSRAPLDQQIITTGQPLFFPVNCASYFSRMNKFSVIYEFLDILFEECPESNWVN